MTMSGYVKDWLLMVVAATLGAAWTLASWVGASDADTNVLGSLWTILAGFLVLGMVAQRWLTPGLTAGAAVAFLAGQAIADEEFRFEADGAGGYRLFLVVFFIVAVPVGLALLGHWLAAAARSRPRAAKSAETAQERFP